MVSRMTKKRQRTYDDPIPREKVNQPSKNFTDGMQQIQPKSIYDVEFATSTTADTKASSSKSSPESTKNTLNSAKIVDGRIVRSHQFIQDIVSNTVSTSAQDDE
jgi:hypothetical protein